MDGKDLTDEVVVALLYAVGAGRGGQLVAEQVDGHWRAGVVMKDELGEAAIELPASGPDRGAALRKLLELEANRKLLELEAKAP